MISNGVCQREGDASPINVCFVPPNACHSSSLFSPVPSLPPSLPLPYPSIPSSLPPRFRYKCEFSYTRARLRLRRRRFLGSHICVLTGLNYPRADVIELLGPLRLLRRRQFLGKYIGQICVRTVIGLLRLLRWGRRCATTHGEHVKNRHPRLQRAKNN